METMTHESWGLCFCGEYHGVMTEVNYVMNPSVESAADVVISPDGLVAMGHDHYFPSIGLRLERDAPEATWFMMSRYERAVAAYIPEPGEELRDAEAVNALPVDSVIADADGFVFQVQESAQFDQHGTVLVHAYLAGIEGMGYASSWVGLNYPATLLRHGGGGAVTPKES